VRVRGLVQKNQRTIVQGSPVRDGTCWVLGENCGGGRKELPVKGPPAEARPKGAAVDRWSGGPGGSRGTVVGGGKVTAKKNQGKKGACGEGPRSAQGGRARSAEGSSGGDSQERLLKRNALKGSVSGQRSWNRDAGLVLGGSPKKS